MNKPIEKVEELAEAVVFFDPHTKQSRDDLCKIIETIISWLEENQHQSIAELLVCYSNIVENEDISDKFLSSLEIIIGSLQSLLRDNQDPKELQWPSLTVASSPQERPHVELPENVDAELFDEYLKIQPAIIDEMDQQLLILEKGVDMEEIGNLSRRLHTLKGESGLMGLVEVEQVCHKIEDSLESTPVHSNPDYYFSMLDWLRSVIKFYRGEGVAPSSLNLDIAPESTFSQEAPQEHPQDSLEDVECKEPTLTINRAKDTLHIDAHRVDALVDAIGELVVAESMVTESDEVKQWASLNFKSHLNQIKKITRELQSLGMCMRMVPVSGTFKKMARLVRDLGKKNGKDIGFFMEGEETEVDRQIVDQIGDILVHMVRNAIDHGIEDSEDERAENSKPAKASITLRAFHRGGNIVVEVEDDGSGLNAQAILEKARENGIVGNEELSEKEIFNLIFEPGFSTADEVTDISGRGVGMDVVRESIERLRGSIDIKTRRGVGSTFTVSLPLTLAIIDGLVVRSATEIYIIPALSVQNSLRPNPDEIHTVMGKGKVLNFQDELIPVRSLSTLFSIKNSLDKPGDIVVILEDEERKVGLLVDELVGKQQVVVKGLGNHFTASGVSGGAIMGDGTVGLIIDVAEIINEVVE